MRKQIIYMAMLLYALSGYGQTSVATIVEAAHILTGSCSTQEQFMPSIAIDKLNAPSILVTYSTTKLYQCGEDNYQAYYFSSDGVNSSGTSCPGSATTLPNSVNSHGFPSVAFDGSEHGFMMGLNSSQTGFFVLTTLDDGNSWGSSTINTTASTNKIFNPMGAADDLTTSTYAGNYYAVWEDNNNDATSLVDLIHTATLSPGGSSFGTNITISGLSGQPNNGPCVATGPENAIYNYTDQAVYICWSEEELWPDDANGIYMGFAVSTDGGVTYTSTTSTTTGGSTVNAAFQYRGLGYLGHAEDPNIGAYVNGFPSMAVDKSCGPHRGRIYVVAAEEELDGSGAYVGSNISLWYSDGMGATGTWVGGHSNPLLHSMDVSSWSGQTYCWAPAVAVDDLTGMVSVVYYGFTGGVSSTNTYVSYSLPGEDPGVQANWSSIQVNSTAQTYEDYAWSRCGRHDIFPMQDQGIANNVGNAIAAYNGHAYPVWSDRSSGLSQNWAADIQYTVTPLASSASTMALLCNPLTPTTIPTETFNAATKMEIANCGGTVSIGSSTTPATVSTTAGESIQIGQGFVTTPGSVFTAEIRSNGGCQTPGVRPFSHHSPQDPSSDGPVIPTDINGMKVYAYPNPTNDLITVGASNNNNYQNVSFIVTDMSGRSIAQYNNPIISNSNVSQIIDASAYSAGLYIVTMTANSQKYSFKFAKE